jgi:Fe-S cluster biosynthesis and repair protein YggX
LAPPQRAIHLYSRRLGHSRTVGNLTGKRSHDALNASTSERINFHFGYTKIRLKQDKHMARTVNCIKLGKEAEGLDFPPYPGELGKRLYENVSKEAWAAWLKHQTMLLNENRLNLADARARQYLARQMEKHFFGDGADAAAGYVPPSDAA